MIIQRSVNGDIVEFELTPREVLSAFYEQEHSFDECDVINRFDEWDDDDFDDYGITREEAKEYISDIAYEKRRLMNKYDIDSEYALSDAIVTVLESETAL